MTTLLVLSLFLLLYAFVGYPVLLALLTRSGSVHTQAAPGMGSSQGADMTAEAGDPATSDLRPSFSMVLSVFNEEAVLDRKIENFLALEYPEGKLSLIIVSDGSTDNTDRIALARVCPRITFLRQEGRLGKTSALNLAVEHAREDILLFTDADAMLRPDCLTRLAEAFADPLAGLAGGRSMYLDASGRESEGSLYRRYEEWIKEREGRLFGIVGADGAVYALRRELYTPLPPEYINDLLHPIQTILAGKRALAVRDAVVTEPTAESDSAAEYARQTRIMAQSWLLFLHFFSTLSRAGRYGFLWQFISHKPLRWLALPFMALAAFAASAQTGFLAVCTLGGLGVLAVFTALGGKGSGGRPGRVAWLFMLQSAAALAGLARLLRGERFITWTPRKQ